MKAITASIGFAVLSLLFISAVQEEKPKGGGKAAATEAQAKAAKSSLPWCLRIFSTSGFAGQERSR